MKATLHPLSDREANDPSDHLKVLNLTRQQIYDTYRALGTVPIEEIEALQKEDALYPAQSVIYLRSVSDFDGKVEGIMRVVTERIGGSSYYNHYSSTIHETDLPRVPLRAKYTDQKFQIFLTENFPKKTELGRLVFGKGVNEFRVLMDMATIVAQRSYLPTFSGNDHFLVVESVRPAVKLYSDLGLTVVEAPIRFNDDRVMMVMPMKELHDRYVGNIDRAKAAYNKISPKDVLARKAAIAGFDEAIGKVSSNPTFQRFYTYGLYERAGANYGVDDFQAMVTDVRELVRRTPNNRDVRFFELHAEAGSRFNWITGVGDPASAVNFLESEASKTRFADSQLPEGLTEANRLFLKGLVYLGAGNIEKARETRVEIDRHFVDLRAEELKKGRALYSTPSLTHGIMRAATIRSNFAVGSFNQRKGNVADALWELEIASQVSPNGLTPAIYELKAELLDLAGKKEEAIKARHIAERLK